MNIQMIKEYVKMQKKGQTLNIVTGVVVSLMVLAFIIFAVLFGISSLNPSSFFTAASAEANATSNFTGSITEGVQNFGQRIPTVFTVLAIVLILAAIVLLVLYVGRMRSVSGSSGGGL